MNIEKLKQIMKEKSMTNYKLAQLSGVSLTQIGKIINGVHTNPRINTIKAIAKALEVDITEII